MKVSGEQVEIIMTALQDYRSNLYLNDNDTATIQKVTDVILSIENEQKSLNMEQKKIMVPMYEVETGSETGIELEDNYNMKPGGCVNCDE